MKVWDDSEVNFIALVIILVLLVLGLAAGFAYYYFNWWGMIIGPGILSGVILVLWLFKVIIWKIAESIYIFINR